MLGCVWSLDSGICGGVYAYMPAKVHLGVYTFACVVFAKGEGFSAFNYSSAKTLHVHSRASQPTDLDTLLRGSSWRKQTREEAWYTHFMGSSTNQLFKYYFLAASLSITAVHHQGDTVPLWIYKQILIKLKCDIWKICCYKLHLKKSMFRLQMDGKKE